MEPFEILDRLAERGRLPVEAINAAKADRLAVVPVFLAAIEQYLSGGASARERDALFFVFHLLGEWREKCAYRPLARLLRCTRDQIDDVVGGAVTETTHRVMAAVFDGDPDPLYQIIRDEKADQFVRSRMCETIAMLAFHGEIPRAEASRFLQACYTELEPQDECFVWHGWQSAVALLGLVELKPLVEQAFERGLISPTWLELKHFEQDLRAAIEDPAASIPGELGEFSVFGDTIEELSTWYSFQAKPERDFRLYDPRWAPRPAVNLWSKVGRNDPCPCGSGRKFKKCCLTKQYEPSMLQLTQAN